MPFVHQITGGTRERGRDVAKHLRMCRMGLGAQAGMPVLLKNNCEENEVATVGKD